MRSWKRNSNVNVSGSSDTLGEDDEENVELQRGGRDWASLKGLKGRADVVLY